MSALAQLEGHLSECTSLASDQYHNMLVTGSSDCKVKLWDLRKRDNHKTFRNNNGAVNTLQISPDAKYVASGSEDGSLRIWDIVADKEIVNFQIAD